MSIWEGYSSILMNAFIVGFVLTVCSAYFFVRDRNRSVAGVPLWMPLLLTGLAMTLVIPAIILFFGSVVGGEAIGRLMNSFIPPAAAQAPSDVYTTCYMISHPTPTPTPWPTPTCYVPGEPAIPGTDALLAIGSLGAAGIAASRKDLLEKLHEEGRIPEKIYNKLKEKKP